MHELKKVYTVTYFSKIGIFVNANSFYNAKNKMEAAGNLYLHSVGNYKGKCAGIHLKYGKEIDLIKHIFKFCM